MMNNIYTYTGIYILAISLPLGWGENFVQIEKRKKIE